MADIPVQDVARILPSLTDAEWAQLGGRQQDVAPATRLRQLIDAFGRGFPEQLWRRHKERQGQLREAMYVLTDAEKEALGDVTGGGPVAQRLLETRTDDELADLRARLDAWRREQRQQRLAAAKPAPLSPIVCTYDFKHPARVNKHQLRTMENLHENFARMLSSTLSGVMRRIVDVDTAFVDQTTYAEYIQSLSNPSCSYQFAMDPMQGQVIMDFAMPLVFGLVDRVHGGQGFSHGVQGRQISQLEMALMARVVKRAVEDLERTWLPVTPEPRIHSIELETNPEFIQISAPSEIVILLAFEVNAPGMTGLVSLCYPFFTLESLLPQLNVQTPLHRSPARRQLTRANNRLRLGGMELPVVAELGRTTVTASTAQKLAPGDVICLETRTDEPSTVFVGGRPKFLGYPCSDGRRERLKIAGRVPPQFAARYGAVDAPSRPAASVVPAGETV